MIRCYIASPVQGVSMLTRAVTVYTVKCWLNCFLRWERKTLRQQYRRCMIDTTTIQFTKSGHHRKEEVGAGQDPQGTEIPAPFWKVDLNSKHSERLHKKAERLEKKNVQRPPAAADAGLLIANNWKKRHWHSAKKRYVDKQPSSCFLSKTLVSNVAKHLDKEWKMTCLFYYYFSILKQHYVFYVIWRQCNNTVQ